MSTQQLSGPTGYASMAESLRIRDAMPCRPRWVALAVTFLTGQPHSGQRPLRLTPSRHLVSAVLYLAGGLLISWLALAAAGGWLLLLPIGWMCTLHGARNARMMVFHQAAHRNLWGKPRRDNLVGRFFSATLLVQSFDVYRQEHVADHHAIHHMTIRDPTVQAFLIGLDLHPGMSRAQMWQRLIFSKLLSPAYHFRFLIGRVHSAFAPAGRGGRALLASCYLGVAVLATLCQHWTFLLVAWVLPMTLFYQVSNTLRLCVKHTFPAPGSARDRRSKDHFASLTNAIFIGEPVSVVATEPAFRRALGWLRWWTRMLLIHFPVRFLVLTGDTVVHDFHHRHPMDRGWANYLFARQQDIVSGHRGWPEYRAVWGIIPAINTVLDSLAAADPLEYSTSRISRSSRRSVFSAYDD